VILHLASLLAQTTTTTVAKHSSGSILDPIAKPIAAVLAAIYSVVPNYGIAILVLSVVWMVLIAPLTLKSTRSMLAMQKLQPQLKRLQEQHKDDRQAFAQAQMDLFREHNVSPFGSCLPMLRPLPVFFALFRVIDGLSHTSKVNGVVHYTPQYVNSSTSLYKHIAAAHGKLDAFGMNLAQNPLSHHSSALAALPYWVVLLVMAGTSYVQTAQMMSRNPAATQNNPQMRMMRYLPLLFVVFCIRFPAGVAVYYVMSNICRIVQQDLMYRFDPKVKALVAQEVVEVEELTHSIDEQQKRGPGYTPPRSQRQAEATPPPSGRSRFRDLLAAAAEQQQAKAAAKDSPARSPGPNGTGNGKPAQAAKGGGSSGRPRQNRSRTNRKKRGR
jgi:YidC/Oxa1 family membrane protein insertase